MIIKYILMPFFENKWIKQGIGEMSAASRNGLWHMNGNGKLVEMEDNHSVPNLSFGKYSYLTLIMTSI